MHEMKNKMEKYSQDSDSSYEADNVFIDENEETNHN